MILKLSNPVEGGWLQTEGGQWVPIFDSNRSCLLTPVHGPTPAIAALSQPFPQIDHSRFFFTPDEFPYLSHLTREWKQLQDEATRLWRERPEVFIEYEGHNGWMAC